MSGHTRGPWRSNAIGIWAGGPGHETLVSERPAHIMLKGGGWDRDQEDANAALIAAAPELLAACRAMSAWLREHTGPSDGTLKMLCDVGVVLAKAEGVGA